MLKTSSLTFTSGGGLVYNELLLELFDDLLRYINISVDLTFLDISVDVFIVKECISNAIFIDLFNYL